MIYLYSGHNCPFSHVIRIIISVKSMEVKIVDVVNSNHDIISLNSNNETPVLVDDVNKNDKRKKLILTDTMVIAEYLNERFPHPQIMPVQPINKARLRMCLLNYKDFFANIRELENILHHDAKSRTKNNINKLKQKIMIVLEQLVETVDPNNKQFLAGSPMFTILDACFLPILWRLNYYDLDLEIPVAMEDYLDRQFKLQSFINSLTPTEKGMR